MNTIDLLAFVAYPYLCLAIFIVSFSGFIALTVWFPTFWTDFFKISLVQAGLLTAAFSLSTSILRVFGGIASDKLGGL